MYAKVYVVKIKFYFYHIYILYGVGVKMNIFLSKNAKSVYFFDSRAQVATESNEFYFSGLLAYIINKMVKGTNSLEKLSMHIKDKFKVKESLDDIKNTIIAKTIKSTEHHDLFSDNEPLNEIKVFGEYGMKYPQIIHIELTSVCNFNCEHCYKNANILKNKIDTKLLFERISNDLNEKTEVLHLTGGEPTLHPEFEKIVRTLSDNFTLQLTSNGTNIDMYSVDLFKKFQGIDISLYGLNDDEYLNNTKNKEGFQKVLNGCRILKNAGINFRETVVLNNENRHQMEEYVKFAIESGAETLGFALPVASGKLIKSNNKKWSLSVDSINEIYREFRRLENKYKNQISLSPWYRSQYSNILKQENPNHELICSGGSISWWMSEDFKFRPCAFLPSEYLLFSYEKWLKYINKKETIDWKSAYERLMLYSKENGVNAGDICSLFEEK